MMQEEPSKPEPVKYTFKTSRIINGHSIEQVAANHMDFRINHRFGYLNSGASNLFGLDAAYIRLGLEYGITDKLAIGIGRNNMVTKAFDYFAKYKLLQQTMTGSMPISTSLLATGATEILKSTGKESLSARTTYTFQALIARKFTDGISLQLMPTMLHRNVVVNREGNSNKLKNDVFALGMGGRFKISKRTSVNLEYFYLHQPETASLDQLRNNLSIGFDIETGGHVFQLFITNSRGMIEKDFIAAPNTSWKSGELSYGFNISRVFSFN
jgi:predicted porin